jgi:hypothetical protein
MIKYLIVAILFISCKTYPASAQVFQTRSNGVVTALDYRSAARWNFYLAWNKTDTSLNGGKDTLGAILHVRSGSKQGVWYRDSVSTGGHQWVQLVPSFNNYWTLSGSNLYPKSNSYNVGIGGTPSYKFHVQNGGELWFNGTRMNITTETLSNKWIGLNSGLNVTGSNNIAIGDFSNEYGLDNNVALGNSALYDIEGGSQNVAIGTNSGWHSPYDNNTSLGHAANSNAYGANNIAIGSMTSNAVSTATATLNTSVITTSSSDITGSSVASFITAASLSVGDTAVFNIVWNSGVPSPYTNSTLNKKGVVTSSNTIHFIYASNFTSQGSGTFDIISFSKQDNAIAIGYSVETDSSNQIAIGNSDNSILKVNQFVVDLKDVPATGEVLTWDGNKAIWDTITGGGGGGSYSFISPLINTAGVVSINNATTSTVGAASFNSSDFIVSSGNASINYASGQTASASLKGFLSAADWITFNAKQASITGAISPYITAAATASRAFVSDVSGKMTTSATTAAEIGYVNGVTSPIQTQLNAKLSTTLASGNIIVGSGANAAAPVSMTGSATISNTGVVTLSSTGVVAGTYASANITVGADGRITAAADGSGGGGSGSVTTVLGTSPIISDGNLVTPTISILNAKADGSTKGAAWFTASDFNDNGSGGISLDYTNGQAASSVTKGYLTSTDWSTFNAKVPTTTTITAGTGLSGGGTLASNVTLNLNSINGFIAAGSNVTITGTGTIGSPYTIASSGGGGGSGTVTSIALAVPTGFTVSGSPITTSGTFTVSTTLNGLLYGNGSNTIAAATVSTPLTYSTGTLGIQVATTAQSGYLTATDWNTFNSKQATITGAATTVTSSNLTASRALISNASGKIDVSATATSTDLTNLVLQYQSQALTDGATITMNCANGYVGTVTLGGSRNITFSNLTAWHTIRIKVTQDGTGGRTLTFPASTYIPVGFGTGTTLNLSTAGAAVDWVYVDTDGTNYWVTLAKNFVH